MSATTQCIAKHGDDRDAHQADVGYLCRPAYSRLERQIAELPALAGWLAVNVAAGGTSALDPNRVSNSGEDPIPIKAAVFDHVEKIRFTLGSWAQMVADERELTGPQNGRPETTAVFLLAHLPWSAEQPWVDDYAEEIEDLTRDAHDLAPSRPEVRRLGAPCPDCGAAELTLTGGEDYVQCRSCGKLIRESEYEWFCRLEAERLRDRSGWVTPEKAAAEHGINPKTVRTWAKRGIIAVVCAVLPGERDDRWRVLPAEVAERKDERKTA